MGKKPTVSVTYEKYERISIKNSLPYLKCVLHLSCVVHGPIYGRFMVFYVNRVFSLYKDVTHMLSKVSCFLLKSFHFLGYRNGRFFSHTNSYILNVTQQCRCSPMLIFRPWATCGKTYKTFMGSN